MNLIWYRCTFGHFGKGRCYFAHCKYLWRPRWENFGRYSLCGIPELFHLHWNAVCCNCFTICFPVSGMLKIYLFLQYSFLFWFENLVFKYFGSRINLKSLFLCGSENVLRHFSLQSWFFLICGFEWEAIKRNFFRNLIFLEYWKRNQGSYQNFNNLNQTIRFFVLIKSICISQNQFKRNVQFMNRYFIDGNKNSLYFSSLQTGLCPKLYHRCTWTISDDAINFKQFKGNKIDFNNSDLIA